MAADKLALGIRYIGNIIDFMVLTIIILLLLFSGYALWDSSQIYHAADKSHYEVYKPTIENQGTTFEELRIINDEVFAWLTVYGTNIDYPVTQGPDNMKYVNTNAMGEYSLSGAIFLDMANSKDFTDFNSILYGHNMMNKTMFGEIGSFISKAKFEKNKYGNLYFDGKDHGIEFFAFIQTDAYNGAVLTPNIGENAKEEYLNNLLATALHKRDIGVTTNDRLVLLNTCSSGITNGRSILVGRITDTLFTEYEEVIVKELVPAETHNCYMFPVGLWLLLISIPLILMLLLYCMYRKRNSNIYRPKRAKTQI